jgi:hypothetical protein
MDMKHAKPSMANLPYMVVITMLYFSMSYHNAGWKNHWQFFHRNMPTTQLSHGIQWDTHNDIPRAIYPLLICYTLLLKPWPWWNSWFTQLQSGDFLVNAFCKRLPEGTMIYHLQVPLWRWKMPISQFWTKLSDKQRMDMVGCFSWRWSQFVS